PLLTWYAAEALPKPDMASAVGLLKTSRIPLIRGFMARRIAALGTDPPIVNVASLAAPGDGATDGSAAFQKAIDQLAPTGGRILVPWSVRFYRIAHPLLAASDHIEFWGPGARLQFAGEGTLTVAGAEGKPVRDLTVRGMRFEGTAAP